ncbi:MAG: hypothetical protein CVV55_02365, partial [Synergistetes bacterium HGW-Synergistetes-2]
ASFFSVISFSQPSLDPNTCSSSRRLEKELLFGEIIAVFGKRRKAVLTGKNVACMLGSTMFITHREST